MASRVLRAALAFGMLGALVALPALPASADESACAGTVYDKSGNANHEIFDVPRAYIPAPLRSFTWDCASRSSDHELNAYGTYQYTLVAVDVSWSTVLDVISAFDAAGWSNNDPGRTVTRGLDDDTAGVFDGDSRLTLAQLRAVSPIPTFLTNEVVHGRDSANLSYFDGDRYVIDEGLRVPTLTIDLILLKPAVTPVGIADPSVLSSLKAIELPTPTQTAVLCTTAVMLMLVVGWPGALLNGVIGKRAEKLFGWTKRGVAGRIGEPMKKAQPRWLVWAGFVIAAVIAGFVDPAFGFNLMSLRLLVGGFLAYLVFNVVGWSVVAAIVRRVQPEARPVINFRWSSLLVVAVAVFAARLLGFQPGVIFGLVAGLAFAVTIVASREALVVLVGSGFALVVALLAWIGYSMLLPVAANSGNGLVVLGTEFLSGLTIEGISSLPLALLPLAVLDGGKLFAWKKWAWGVAYAIGLAAFMYVLLNVPGSFGEVQGDFVRWIVIFVTFGILAIAVWAVDARLARRAVPVEGHSS